MKPAATAPFPEARILVVDDQPDNIMLVRRLLGRMGYPDTHGFTSPVEALRDFAGRTPDLVLLDAHMPGLSGFEVLRRIVQMVPADVYVPVMMLTGDNDPDIRHQALELGAMDFLAKPFDMAEVGYRVRNLLRTRQLYLQVVAGRAVLEQRVEQRTRALEAAHADALGRLAQAAEFRDEETGQHTQRVGITAARVAQAMGLAAEAVVLIRQAAPLHDVGKIAIPDAVLLKPGPLTAEEWVVMKNHTLVGAQLLGGGGSPLMELAEQIALSHHERWDGSGYPHGRSGEEIPVAARIVALADYYDALTSDRPYRSAWPRERVLEAISQQVGLHFDPAVVAAFESVRDEIPGGPRYEPAPAGAG